MAILKLFGLAAIAFFSLAASQSIPVSTFCAPNDVVCASINVPETGDDIFLQITAPTRSGWAGIGLGDQMAGTLIFVVYENEDGDDVVVSPRIAVAHVLPQYVSDIDITMLEGSGVKGNTMTANFKCSNCRTWSPRGQFEVSDNTGFIWAIGGSGQRLRTNEVDAEFTMHQTKGNFRLDVEAARGGNGTENPFTSENMITANSGVATEAPKSKADRVIIAHGTIMAFSFLVLFPIGATAPRIIADKLNGKGVAIHRGIQITAFILVIVAMAMGIWVSGQNKTHFNHPHQVLGVIIPSLLLLQAFLGQFHHHLYRRNPRRTLVTHSHIWLGRIVIALGIINGGAGLVLEKAPVGGRAAYAVVAVLVVGGIVSVGLWRAWCKGTREVKGSEGGMGGLEDVERKRGPEGYRMGNLGDGQSTERW